MSKLVSFMKLTVLVFLVLLQIQGIMKAQLIYIKDDTIFVEGSKYHLQIDRVSGIVTIQNPEHVYYTHFPLFAELLPASVVSSTPILSWKVNPQKVEMTAKDPVSKRTVLKAILKFKDEAFEVHFGIIPKIQTFDYEVNIINGSWPWGLGVDTSFARNVISLNGNKFQRGLGAHSYSNVKFTFRKPVEFRSFEALVGVDEEVNKKGSVVFQVLTDGKKVADSGVIKGGEKPRKFEAFVEGAKTIELIATDAGDGIENDHADWANAKFISDHGNTIYVSDLISDLQQGLRIFSLNGRGFDTNGWLKMFTPEPDNYYSDTSVMVDVRQDVDGQRFYAPSPLNLSFKTKAGWFSVGLCQLPDATGFRFQNSHLFINYQWSKMKLPDNQLYWVTPICFTFNQSEWDAIEDYRNYLLRHNYISDIPIEKKKIPAWWMYPLICTWGEQTADDAWQSKPRFTTEWVKNYVLGQEKALELDYFTVIIDDKWQKKYGDPNPDPSRFGKMRELVDWIHGRGHKVLLWWRCWYGEEGSLPDQMGLLDKGYIDATHPLFENYVKRAVRKMMGNGPGELNADGFKIDYIFDVRDPTTATYAQPSLGMGIREVYRFASIWYREAKKVKKDCLITFSGPDPHFSMVQDMTRINDAGIDSLQRQYRARVSALSTPNLLIDGDGADMFVSLADYHHIVSSAYGTPSLYYLSHFPDGPITADVHKVTGKIFHLSSMKKPGNIVFRSFGNWQFVRNGKVIAESFQDGTAFIVYPESRRALLLSTKQQDLIVHLHDETLEVKVKTEEGTDVKFIPLSGGNIMIPDTKRGGIYIVSFRKK